MKSIKSQIVAVSLFAVLAGFAAAPADAASDGGLSALDRKIVEAKRLILEVNEHPDATPQVVEVLVKRYESGLQRRILVALVDKKIVQQVARNRDAAGKYARYAHAYNTRGHRLSRAEARRMHALLLKLHDSIGRDTARLNTLYEQRDDLVAALATWFARFNGGIREALNRFPVS